MKDLSIRVSPMDCCRSLVYTKGYDHSASLFEDNRGLSAIVGDSEHEAMEKFEGAEKGLTRILTQKSRYKKRELDGVI